MGSEQKLVGRRILFWMSGNAEETAAFRHSKPQGPLGRLGRVVLYAGGKPYDWPLDGWQAGSRRALGDSGLEAELAGVDTGRVDIRGEVAEDVQVRLNIHRKSASQPLVLSAEFPEVFSRQDYDDQVFGTYWPGLPEAPAGDAKTKSDEQPVAPPGMESRAKAAPPAKTNSTAKGEPKKPEEKADAKKPEDKTDSQAKPESAPAAAPVFAPPRIDFFQGADRQLYLRTWRAGEVSIRGPLEMGESGGSLTAFRGTPDAVALWFGDFQPADRPGFSARAKGLDQGEDAYHLRQAYVRLTVDDQSQEFWMPCSTSTSKPGGGRIAFNPVEDKVLKIPQELQQKTVAGKDRRVELSFEPDSFHLGYSINLHYALRKLDPGTRQPSFFGSEIDLVPNEFAVKSSSADSPGKQPPKYENLLVTLNAPLDFADPAVPGRSYRMFQSTMSPPYDPEEFGRKPGESVYLSGFRLNYDPGRGLTYVGCLLVVAGIFVAYFVRFVIPKKL